MKKERNSTKTVARAGAYQPPRYEFKVSRTLQPGSKGTQGMVDEYHESLYCVRYRDDEEHGMRYTTIELIRSARPLPRRAGPFKLDDVVSIRTRPTETGLQRRLQAWGGTWDAQRGCWQVAYKVARKLRVARRAQPATPRGGVTAGNAGPDLCAPASPL